MTITAQDTRKISFEEYMAFADEDTHTEWVRGEVVDVSPVSNRHQQITKFLLRLIDEFVEQGQLGEVRYEGFAMRLASIPSAREPDLLFVRSENADRIKSTFLDGPADLVIEVVSLESRERDRGTKFYEYAQGGVPEYWIIDHERETAEFFHLTGDGRYEAAGVLEDGYYRSRQLTGFRIASAWLWLEPLPKVRDVLSLTNIG